MLLFQILIPSISLKEFQGNRRSYRHMTSTSRRNVSNKNSLNSREKQSRLTE
jgi:hypothetical protein